MADYVDDRYYAVADVKGKGAPEIREKLEAKAAGEDYKPAAKAEVVADDRPAADADTVAESQKAEPPAAKVKGRK